MNYQEARRVRKTGLLSLINEGLFDEGKGIGGAVGGAISKRFKAKSVGIQEALDPLNWVRKLTGQGAVGDLAVTGLGRLFGRSNSAITAFGGYGRKNKNKKKNPQRTTVGARQIKPLKVGDSSADILGKMYNFMQKTHEIYKLNYQIEDAFRQEQMDEDERRHKKLIEAILNRKIKPADDKGVKSFIDKLIEGIKSGLSFVLSPFLKWISKFDYAKIIKDTAKIVITALTTTEAILKRLAFSIFDFLAGPLKAMIIAVAGALILAHEYENLRSDRSRAGEAERAANNLSQGPTIKKGEMTDGLIGNIQPEFMEDYSKGKLGLYDNVPIPDTGGKSAPLLLTDAEAKILQENFKNLQHNYLLLQKLKDGELDPQKLDLDKLKEAIIVQKLNIGNIEKKGLSRLKISGAGEKYGLPFMKGYSSLKANEDIDNLITTYSSPEAKNKIGQSPIDKEIDSIIDKSMEATGLNKLNSKMEEIPKFQIPEQIDPQQFNNKLNSKMEEIPKFQIPEQIDPQQFNNKIIDGKIDVYGNNTVNNIGGAKPKQVSLNTPNPRNSDLQSYLKHTSAYV